MKLSQIILAWRRKEWPIGTLITLAWIVEAGRPVTYDDVATALVVSKNSVMQHAELLEAQGFVARSYDGPKGAMGRPQCLVTATALSRDILSRQSVASLPDHGLAPAATTDA